MDVRYLTQRSFHKYYNPPSYDFRLWHATSQLSWYSLAEGFGLPVAEAMRLGKPVFLSRLTSLPEVGGAAAYYFEELEPAAMRLVLATGLVQHSPERVAAGAPPYLAGRKQRLIT